MTNKEKNEENKKFASLIGALSKADADSKIQSFSYKTYSYVINEWSKILPDFVHTLKADGLDMGIQTTNRVEGFFGKLK